MKQAQGDRRCRHCHDNPALWDGEIPTRLREKIGRHLTSLAGRSRISCHHTTRITSGWDNNMSMTVNTFQCQYLSLPCPIFPSHFLLPSSSGAVWSNRGIMWMSCANIDSQLFLCWSLKCGLQARWRSLGELQKPGGRLDEGRKLFPSASVVPCCCKLL